VTGGERTSTEDCVFCTRRDQPAPLFETPSPYVMPDKFPMRPGHTLIISTEHRSCYGAAPTGLLRELDGATARVRAFLERAYGGPVLAFENGISGQTVFHAHLHLIPSRIGELPPELARHGDICPVEDWRGVRERFARDGCYRYAELGGKRYVIAGHSPVLRPARRLLAEATGLAWGAHGFAKATSPADVRELERRWCALVRGDGQSAHRADG
jgi:diadenosine tetraphosphate (Ap4A) HIT family hydrolase